MKNLIKKIKKIKELRLNNFPTIPVILHEEMETNIFFRTEENSVKSQLNMLNSKSLEVFTKLRDLKDRF